MTRSRRRVVVAASIVMGMVTLAVGALAATRGGGGRQVVAGAAGFAPPTTGPDATTLVSLVPVPSGPGAGTALPSAATAPTATSPIRPSPCSSRQVAASMTTDRPSYRPGDVIVVTATVTNPSGLDCTVALTLPNGSCQPQVVVHAAFVDGVPTGVSPTYNAALGPFTADCSAGQAVVPARGTYVTSVRAPFAAGPGGYLHAGVWTVFLEWDGVTGNQALQSTVRCDVPACLVPSPPVTAPSPTTTVPVPLPTTTSTSTLAPAGSSTTSTSTSATR